MTCAIPFRPVCIIPRQGRFCRPLAGFLAAIAAAAGLLASAAVAGAAAESATPPPVIVAPDVIVAQTLAYSRQLQAADQDTAAATARRDQARAAGLPALDFQAQAGHYEGLQDMAFGPGPATPAIDDRAGAAVTLAQPLYTGGRIRSQKEAAGLGLAAAREFRRAAAADLRLQALTAYWNWSKAFHSVNAFTAAVARMEAHFADMRNRFAAGTATDNDLLSAEVQASRTQLQLEEAKRRVALARARIAFLTGQELAESAIPIAAEVDAAAAADGEEGAARADLEARRLEAAAAAKQVAAQKAELWPQLSFVARYEQARPNLLNVPPEDRWDDNAYVGLAVTWNIWDWGLRKAKVREAAARAEQARLRVEQETDQVRLEIREARINLQDAAARLRVAERSQASAKRNLQAANDLWENGLTRHAELLDAHAQLTDAGFEVIAARADWRLARAALDHARGRLDGEAEGKPRP
ncbi:MAG: TolC family protein [Lentisphaeria bacterium]|jgi:outer membrane protein TolC